MASLACQKVESRPDLLRLVRFELRVILCPVFKLVEPIPGCASSFALEGLQFTDNVLLLRKGSLCLKHRGEIAYSCEEVGELFLIHCRE